MVLELRAAGDAELEVWAAQRHVQPFEELMQKPVRLALRQQAAIEAANRGVPARERRVSS